MSCTQSQLVLLIEYIERRVEDKMKKLGLNPETRRQILVEIERVKQNILEQGLAEIQKELGI